MISSSIEGCVLGANEYSGQKTREFVSFGSNPYSDRVATLTYKEEGKEATRHYSPKSQAYFVAEDIIKNGMSSAFLCCSPLIESGEVSNEKALKFYQEVEAEIKQIGHYKVAIAVSNFYDYENKEYSYTPYFVRSRKDSIKVIVFTLPVEQNYTDLLQSPEVIDFVALCKAEHEDELAKIEAEKQQSLLAKEQELEEAKALLIGATYVSLENGSIKMLALSGRIFYIHASGDYDNQWLVVGGYEV